MVNKKFLSVSWTYPTKNMKTFRGAVQEYAGVDGSKIAVAFTETGAYVLKDEQGYFGTLDYVGKGGVFSQGDIEDFAETIKIGDIIIGEDGNSIDFAGLNDEIEGIPFADAESVKEDIVKRLRLVAPFGFYTIASM